MPNIIYTKKARKSIKSLDIRVKDGIEKIPFGDIKKLQGYSNLYRSGSAITGLSTRWSMIQSSLLLYCPEAKHIKDCRRWFYEQRYIAWPGRNCRRERD